MTTPPPPDGGASRRARLLGATVLVLTGTCFPVFLASALAVQVQASLGLSDQAYGLALTCYFAAMGATSVAGGRLGDRVGWYAGTISGAAVAVLSLAGIALFARSWLTLTLFLVVGGMSQGIASPVANLTITSQLPVQRRGILLGVKQTASPLSATIAGLLVPLLALRAGWRAAFAMALLVPLAGVLTLPRTRLARARGPRAARTRGVVDLPLVTLAMAGGLASVGVGAVTTFLVLSGVEAGLSEARAGVLFAVGSGLGLGVRVLAGWWADRSGTDGFRPVAVLLGLGALGVALLASGRAVLVVPGAVLACAGGWGWPGLFHLGLLRHHEHAPATATGVTDTGLAVGTAVGPFVFGLVATRWSYGAAWSIFAANFVVAALLLLWAGAGLARRAGARRAGLVGGEA